MKAAILAAFMFTLAGVRRPVTRRRTRLLHSNRERIGI